MNSILSEKKNTPTIIHPITLHIVMNKSNKFLSMPSGTSELLSKQNYFTNNADNLEISTNHNEIFLSSEYYFKAIFNVASFEDRLTLMNEIIDSNRENIDTIRYIFSRFTQTFKTLCRKQLYDIINIEIKFQKQLYDKNISFSEMNKIVRKKYKNIINLD